MGRDDRPRSAAILSSTATVASASMRRRHSIASASRKGLVEDRQELEDPPVVGSLVELEVNFPDMVRILSDQACCGKRSKLSSHLAPACARSASRALFAPDTYAASACGLTHKPC